MLARHLLAASLLGLAACSTSGAGGFTPPGPCRLPAPVRSTDACSTDADCGPSDPCHAHACVAREKARARAADTFCTELMDCASTDANRCGCVEGRCTLSPPL